MCISKSFCNASGQILSDDGSSSTDAQLRCDYRQNYDYVIPPKDPCSVNQQKKTAVVTLENVMRTKIIPSEEADTVHKIQLLSVVTSSRILEFSRNMLRSISTHNFIHFIKPQRLEFKDGTNYIVGGNSTGKSAIFELIRRSLSNDINTTSSSFTIDSSIAYSICHFKIPDGIKQQFPCNPTDIISGLFVEKANEGDEGPLSYYYYKVLVMTKELNSLEILITRFEGLRSCNSDELHSKLYLYYNFNNGKVSESIKELMKEGNHGTYHKSILSLFVEIKQNAIFDENICNQDKVDNLFKSLEDGYVSVLPMRSIGPLQWTRSEKNCHSERKNNYTIACQRAEIINNLLDSDKTDTHLLNEYHKLLVAPYRFQKRGKRRLYV
ncbi:unnamed protein product [Mytilus edulis]|uniref:Rad50/SbcC-type AAA domain-containing protein n=1 Tax=Mytilus edulis TaxID=6550 RepID=A0A8S3USA9_MYTED|nr:unnamed protein product [Mytilus edulis]